MKKIKDFVGEYGNIIIIILLLITIMKTCTINNNIEGNHILEVKQLCKNDSLQDVRLKSLESNVPTYIYFGIRTNSNFPNSDLPKVKTEYKNFIK
jgi:hypothetical protein